jgi:hypothetical protein
MAQRLPIPLRSHSLPKSSGSRRKTKNNMLEENNKLILDKQSICRYRPSVLFLCLLMLQKKNSAFQQKNPAAVAAEQRRLPHLSKPLGGCTDCTVVSTCLPRVLYHTVLVFEQPLEINSYSTTHGLLLHGGLFVHPLNCVMLFCTLLLHCKKG